jgi:predicted amidohydrolase YtcJ
MNVSIEFDLSRSYAASQAGFRRATGTALAAIALAAATPALANELRADLVFVGGAIYTVDAARSWASAVAVRDGRIVYVGDDSGARALVGAATRVIALEGRMLLPGFQDSHVHPLFGGVELIQCDLQASESAAEVLARVERCAAELPGDDWLEGSGWDLPLFPGGNPHRRALDAIAAHRPIVLSSADGHTVWVNSRALELAGITATTPDPPAGRIERDADGSPSGTLRESAAALVRRLVPPPSAELQREGLRLGVAEAHRFGITGLVEAKARADTLAAYAALDAAGELDLHVTAALYVDEELGREQLAEIVRLRDTSWGPHVRADAAKLFVDGVLEAQTGALLAPYVGRGEDRGELVWSEERLREFAIELDRAGFQLHLHAIGDRAIRVTFDALEAVAAANGPRDRRPALAHIQLFDPADIGRFRRLGAVASFQPLWAYEDSYIRDLTVPFLGPERSRWLYPIGSVARTGAILAGGSDWSVSSMNPLLGIEVAITRRIVGKPFRRVDGRAKVTGQRHAVRRRPRLPADGFLKLVRAHTVPHARIRLDRHQRHLGGGEGPRRARLPHRRVDARALRHPPGVAGRARPLPGRRALRRRPGGRGGGRHRGRRRSRPRSR